MLFLVIQGSGTEDKWLFKEVLIRRDFWFLIAFSCIMEKRGWPPVCVCI